MQRLHLTYTPYRMEMSEYDEVARRFEEFSSKTLFHERPWLEYLEATGKGKPEVLALRDEAGDTPAYHIWLTRRIGPVKVMGSPLPGWTTNFMGPLMGADTDLDSVLVSLKRYMWRNGYLYAELKNQALDENKMLAHGFQPVRDVTAVLQIAPTEEETWSKLKSTARNRVRKAQKSLVAEATTDMDMIDEYYELIVERYREQGMSFPFSVERLKTLARCLLPHGRLLLVKVIHEGELAAAGLFPHDERTIYYFGGASKRSLTKLCPNELMHWTAISHAVEQGIGSYDLCGTSQFKRKFGATNEEVITWCYSPVPGLLLARTALIRLHWARLRLLHRLKSWMGGKK